MLNLRFLFIFNIIIASHCWSTPQDCYEQQRRQYEEIQTIDIDENTKTSVLTYNLGMLKSWPIAIPNYPGRNALLGHSLNQFIKENQPDFMAFQEVWTSEVFSTLNSVAKYNSYQMFHTDYKNDQIEKNGIQILISNKWEILEKKFHPYKKKAWFEEITGYQRGVFVIYLKNIKTGKKLKFSNTHLSPMKDQWTTRESQLREMIQFVENFRDQNIATIHVGDLNFSDEFGYLDDKRDQQWNLNAKTYELVCQYDLIDSFRMLNTEPGYSYDTTSNMVTHQGFLELEPRQRLDYIFIRPFQDVLHLLDSKLVFTEEFLIRKTKSVKTQLSDHYGVYSTIQFAN